MIKVKDGYGKLIGTTYKGSATQVLLSNGGNLEFSSGTKANTLVQRNANQHVYATYFNSAISDEALSDVGSVYVRNTSDTFIRRISKTQFYSIIDNKFVTLDTAQTITGVKTFSTGPILATNAIITQKQGSTSNYTTVIKWLKGGTSQGTYNPSIGQHNTGGDGTGSICILPYPTSTSPWNGTVGLFISKGVLRLDGKAVAIAENYYDKETSDGRYAYRQGTNATGTWPIRISIKDIRNTSPKPNDKTDTAADFWFNNTDKPGSSSWYSGITIKGWTDGYAVWQLASNSASTITDDNLYFRSGINTTWNAWRKILDSTNYSAIVNGNYYTKTESDNRYVNVTGDTMTGPLIVKASITGTQLISNIANGTAPLKVTSKTVVTNLNSDLLDGYHETSFFRARGSQTIASSIPTKTELSSNNNLSGSWIVSYPGAAGHLVQFNAGSGSTRYMQFYSHYSGSLYWRNSTDSTLSTKSWKTIVDSANYTGIVLKIGTATKGSATLPIYLNAGTPTACSTTLGVSITGNAATATKLQTARTINGTSFNGTTNITTAYWGATRTITLSGAVTGSASINGSKNVTITTTYQTGSIDGRYVGGKKTAGHGSQGTAYTADTYSSNFVNKAFVAYAERGSWAYANNGYITTNIGVNIPLAGTAVFQWGASDTNKTQLFITPYNYSGVSNPAANEMLFYTSNGSGYTSAWTRVLTHRNYTTYTVTKTGGGASGTWGISITGTAAAARKIYKIDGTTRTWSTANSIVGNGLVSYTDTSTSGRWDSYGSIFQFSNTDNPTPGTYGHWLTQIWSGTSNKLGVRWRTNTGSWSAMQTILTNTNYVSYADTRYVTALGTNGNYVTWTKNGTTNNLTVPFATTSNVLNNLGNRTAISGTTVGQSGLRLYKVYNNGYPVAYGNVLNIGGLGYGELLFQWTGDSNPGHLYYRSKRDVASQAWSNWVTILDNNNYSSTLDGRYVTLTTNQTVSGIKTFSKQQKFTVATGTSPFTVSSTTVVSNLNADLLDGFHAASFYQYGYVMFARTIDASGLSTSTYYPVTFNIGSHSNVRIECRVSLNSGTKPSWSTHSGGFSVRKIWEVNGSGWGATPVNRRILVSDYAFANTDPVRGVGQLTNSSVEYVYVRGGGKYLFYISHNISATLRTSTYTTSSQSVSPTTSAPAVISTPTLTFTAGRFSALSYKPTTGINTVYIPTNTSHLTNDSGFLTGNVIRAVNANGYWGMARPDSNASDWIRTTSAGIIPYQSGGKGSGHCGLGTSGWYFSYAYIDTVHGNLNGTATNADKLDGYHETSFFRSTIKTISNEVLTNIPANRSGSYILTRSGWNGSAFVLHVGSSNSSLGFLVKGGQSANVNLITATDSSSSKWADRGVILTTLNYTSTLDRRYVNVSGDTMTGKLSWSMNGVINSIESQNSSYTHYSTTASVGHWFNKQIRVQGEIYAGSGYNQKVWHAGNDGTGSGLDADLLDGTHKSGLLTSVTSTSATNLSIVVGGTTKQVVDLYANYAVSAGNADKLDGFHANTSQNPFGKIPTIGSNGVMEVGRYLDFHYNSSDTSDFRTRLQINHSSGSYTAILPAKSGTLAMTSDIPTVTNYYWANVKVSSSSSTSTSPTFSTAYTSNWFRSNGQTGWYSQTYGGGIYMTDSSYVRVYGGKRFYAASGYLSPYGGGSWISMATRTNCIVADQNNSASSAHALFRVKNSSGHAIAFGGLGANIGFYGFYASRISSGANGTDWSTVWNAGTGVITHSKTIYTAGYYHSSVNSNNYVLLAGGSYKNLADFAKGNAGSATQGVYVTSGTVKAMTYSLKATVNSGTANKLAYYSSATAISSYTSTVGATNRGIYMNAGVPTVMTYNLNATVESGASSKIAYYKGANLVGSYTDTIGSSVKPIYLNAGTPTACTVPMVRYWAAYRLSMTTTSASLSKMAGNHSFVSSYSREDAGRVKVTVSFPSGWSKSTTLIFGNGSVSDENNYYAPCMLTVQKEVNPSDAIRLIVSDDATVDNRYTHSWVYFLCIS